MTYDAQRYPAVVTATTDGSGTGAISTANKFVSINSSSQSKVVTLGTSSAGREVHGYVGLNGVTMTASGATINGAASIALDPNYLFWANKPPGNNWVVTLISRTGVVVPVPYLDSGVISATASQSFPAENGLYEIVVEGATKQKKTALVADGVYTVTPANSDPTFTRARFFGPYQVQANTGDTQGASIVAGAIFNSNGLTAFGRDVMLGNRVTQLSQSPNVFPAHAGFIGSDPNYYYTLDNNGLYKRSRADWSVISSNTSPFTNISPANHLGGGKLYNGMLYVAAARWGGSCGAGTNSVGQIARYSATDLSFIDSHILGGIFDQSFSGLAIDAAGGIIYAVTYCDATRLYRYDLRTFEPLSTITLSVSFDQIQDVAYKNGRLYLACQPEGTAVDTIAVLDTAGHFIGEIRPTDWTNTMEGLDFDVATGQLGIAMDNQSSGTESRVIFYADYVTPTLSSSGWSSNKNSFAHFVNCEGSATGGTIYTRFSPNSFFNFNEIWDNTGSSSTYEGWLPSAGSLNGRVSSGATRTYAGPAVVGTPLTYAHSWDATSEALYVNNADRVTSAVTSPAWVSGADFGLAGVNNLNTAGDNKYSYAYVFSVKLSEADKQAVEANPGKVLSAIGGLTSSQLQALAPGAT